MIDVVPPQAVSFCRAPDSLGAGQSIAKLLGDQRATMVALLNDTQTMGHLRSAGASTADALMPRVYMVQNLVLNI